MQNLAIRNFITLAGQVSWQDRVEQIHGKIRGGGYSGKLAASRFAAECAIEKAKRGQRLSDSEAAIVSLATRLPELHETLLSAGKLRLSTSLSAALSGDNTIIPLLHLLYTAQLQKNRGFKVAFTGFSDATPFDLLISRDGATAEIACDTISAEDGHAVHRGAWTQLIDRIDPDLQTWLAAHPGRYLLKMTLPNGLKPDCAPHDLPALQTRIKNMLASARRADYDEAAVLRLDPLLLAGAQATGDKLQPANIVAKLRREFGPEAHFAITEAGQSVFVLAARGGAENEVAAAVRRRLAAIAPARLSGERPGILSIFITDTDQLEWRILREQLLLEGEARHFLTFPEAKAVVAVTCMSRFELMNAGVAEGDLRFRNPMHPAAKSNGLAPAVLSTV